MREETSLLTDPVDTLIDLASIGNRRLQAVEVSIEQALQIDQADIAIRPVIALQLRRYHRNFDLVHTEMSHPMMVPIRAPSKPVKSTDHVITLLPA